MFVLYIKQSWVSSIPYSHCVDVVEERITDVKYCLHTAVLIVLFKKITKAFQDRIQNINSTQAHYLRLAHHGQAHWGLKNYIF